MGNNNDEYNFDAAFHYKAYRPPLHTIILDRCIGNQIFESALDVGCGVGNSTIALTKFCDQVVGYDPSESMIQQAQKHEMVKYVSNLEKLNPGYSLVCFFGCLFYIDSEMLEFYSDHLTPGGNILCCDFEIIYNPVLDDMGISVSRLDYDHAKNLDAYDTNQTILIVSEQFEVEFTCQNHELVHLLLSETNIKEELSKKFDSVNVYQPLLDALGRIYPTNQVKLNAGMYYSYYRKTIH